MRILVVEDDTLFASTLKRVLERDGLAVDHVGDGESAGRRAAFSRDRYDLIVLDLTLPKLDGLDVCTYLRNKNVATPILVTSGRTESVDIVGALDKGADDYITKPFSMDEFLARVRALVRRPPKQLAPVLSHNGLELNPNTHHVNYKGREIEFTPKEFSILMCFMRQPDQVLTRGYLIEHVWDFAFDSCSNLVDVHIKNIRNKLKNEGCGEFIRTVRGVGYQL